jgi:serine/threonine-protein kinase RsbT
MEPETPSRVAIDDESDVVLARKSGRAVAEQVGMSSSLQTMVATAISEIARNIVVYAGRGEVVVRAIADADRRGIEVLAHDQGAGIEDVEQAMQDGFSTAGSLGLGLPGARRLMDEFSLESNPGEGTTVVMRKWVEDGTR